MYKVVEKLLMVSRMSKVEYWNEVLPLFNFDGSKTPKIGMEAK